ncbi:Nucleolar Complex 2 protein, partial [Ceratobasidium sp. 392]
MGKKASKSTRKFAASGELKRTITARRKHKAVRQKAQTRSAEKEKRQKARSAEEDEGSDEEEMTDKPQRKGKAKTVDDLLSGAFLDGADDSDAGSDAGVGGQDDFKDSDSEDGESDIPDDESFASLDEDEGAAHAMDLAALKTTDPEFYKYLQENDKELLDFDASEAELSSSGEEEAMDKDKEEEEEETPLLTTAILKEWQKSLLETHSLRSLRRLLIAFRSAAHMNDEDVKTAWRIDSAVVFNKLVTTALKYTPIIAAHHMPYKTLPNGKFKPPASTARTSSLSKLLLSHVQTAVHLIGQLPSNPVSKQKKQGDDEDDSDSDLDRGKRKSKDKKAKGKKGKSRVEEDEDEGKTALIELALSETAKLTPYIVGSRKAVKAWLKTCLSLWSTAADSVRISAFLAIRQLALSSDEAIVDLVQKNTYLALLRTSKSSSQHTIPSLTLMKNSASELYALDRAAAYTTAFGYIRQLAVHLRASTKVKTKA